MSENAGQFRSATIGGFNKQDVLEYIERVAKENAKEREAILAENQELAAALEEERKARATAEEHLLVMRNFSMEDTDSQKASEEQILRLQTDLADKTEALAVLETEAAELRKQVKEFQPKAEANGALETEVEELRKKVKELQPEAEAWQRIRDTAGNIEVSAHERAQITIQEAKANAEAIQAEANRQVMEIQTRCEKLQQDLRNAILASERELDVVRASFAQAEKEMNIFQDAYSAMTEDSED